MNAKIKLINWFVAVLSISILSFCISPQTVYSYEPYSFQSARAMGMGGCITAIDDDPFVVFYNPAGLASINQRKIIAFGTSYQDYSWNIDAVPECDLNLSQIGLLLSYTQTNFGFAGTYWIRGDKNERKYTTEFGPKIYKFKDLSYETSLIFGIAKNLSESFSVGANIKYLRSDAEEEEIYKDVVGKSMFNPEQTISTDVGVLFHFTPKIEIGASFHNLYSSKLDYRVYHDYGYFGIAEELPINTLIGASIRLNDRYLIGIDVVNLIEQEIKLRGTQNYTLKPELHLGAEVFVCPYIPFRAGFMMTSFLSETYPEFKYRNRNTFTLGSGYQHDRFQIDLACVFDNIRKDMEENPLDVSNITFQYLASLIWKI